MAGAGNSKYGAEKTKQMGIQTRLALKQTIRNIQNVDEYNVKELNGVQIVGPMKWVVLIFGPNHQAKDLKDIIEQHKNLNIIILLVTNSASSVQK